MSLFKKLFGGKSDPAATQPALELPADSPAFQGDPIKAHDKFGREILITRKDWFEGVLKGNLEKAWDQPDELVNLINGAFNDEFTAVLDSPTRRLLEIDPDPERGSVYRAVYLLQTSQPAAAETVLQDYIEKHGQSGLVMVNLAKAQHALGRVEDSENTLWRGMELDPNQANGLGWVMALHRERGGADAERAILEKIAALPGSWRAPLWQARAALDAKDLETAKGFYAQALARTARPVSFEVLQQMSGDLGNHGHLPELLTLTLPHFDVSIHGMAVGNNLIKASIDTGQLDQARQLMRLHQQQQRPDWTETLTYWEGQLSQAQHDVAPALSPKDLQITMVQISGPIWLKADGPFGEFFPAPPSDKPRVLVMGNTFETAVPLKEVKMGTADNPGRFCRALPLFLSETLHLGQMAQCTSGTLWAAQGGFVVSGVESEDEGLVGHAQQVGGDDKAADYVIYSHLITRGENWTVQTRLLRVIDGKRLAEFSYDFAEAKFSEKSDQVVKDMVDALRTETDGDALTQSPTIPNAELDHYLFRLEQALATICATMDGAGETLSNPADILDGMLHLCLQNPTHAESRLLLLRTARALQKIEPELLKSFQSKIENLMADSPLIEPLQTVLQKELNEVLVA